MPDYRRARVAGGTFFFTVVTAERQPILTTPTGLRCFREAWRQTRTWYPFSHLGGVVLPDHLHTIWRLPDGDDRFALRWSTLKRLFTVAWLAAGGAPTRIPPARRRRRRVGVWQPRYWEHVIRDDEDLARHLDYIHFNPVHHGLAAAPADWPHSTFGRYVRQARYPADWGSGDALPPIGRIQGDA